MANHEFRSTGRTTRRIARYVVDLLAAPGVPLTIMDHNDLHNSHRTVHHSVQTHLKMLGVDFLADEVKLTITVKPIKKRSRK